MTCAACGRTLPPDAYYRSNRSRCRDCVKAASAARRQANPAAHREATRRWREREQARAAILEHVLRIMAYRDRRAFFDAILETEDSLGMEPGTALDLFARDDLDDRRNHELRGFGVRVRKGNHDAA